MSVSQQQAAKDGESVRVLTCRPRRVAAGSLSARLEVAHSEAPSAIDRSYQRTRQTGHPDEVSQISSRSQRRRRANLSRTNLGVEPLLRRVLLFLAFIFAISRSIDLLPVKVNEECSNLVVIQSASLAAPVSRERRSAMAFQGIRHLPCSGLCGLVGTHLSLS